jgi:hypothetical protein
MSSMVANNLNTAPLVDNLSLCFRRSLVNDGILYGINRHNNSLILFDRFKTGKCQYGDFSRSRERARVIS